MRRKIISAHLIYKFGMHIRLSWPHSVHDIFEELLFFEIIKWISIQSACKLSQYYNCIPCFGPLGEATVLLNKRHAAFSEATKFVLSVVLSARSFTEAPPRPLIRAYFTYVIG